MMLFSLKKPYEIGQVYKETGSQELIFSKQLFNVHLFITDIEFSPEILAMNISISS